MNEPASQTSVPAVQMACRALSELGAPETLIEDAGSGRLKRQVGRCLSPSRAEGMPSALEPRSLSADVANRPEPDWQGRTLRIRHVRAEWSLVGRARVSTTQLGVR